jgi:hypothetical protein
MLGARPRPRLQLPHDLAALLLELGLSDQPLLAKLLELADALGRAGLIGRRAVAAGRSDGTAVL